ncbi:protein PLASTID MOVEMENT IMPAIRED 1-RELATED 1 isoform X1 [Rosa chinensis]|uniref:protein PLASTID MOVEMENT IMPAIRED 1-RELATED 1 isoform X1 n=1 Tax=Rosa chinensis TaxID=74649 RepID=UPI001AD8D28D|nr:protein PLASTID MOVEMENT IMPAIRED 1-RELATED 1 isoform X1 [Rosa chinensis]
MMMQKTESKKSNSSGQLLRDIEEISKALYLHKPPPKALLPPPPHDSRSKSAEKTRFSGSNSNPAFLREDLLHKDKKSSSIWNWKKPLKALSHIGNRKFNCCFYLHVHALEGLPVSFNNLSVCVHWKRKDEVLQTSCSMVEEGMAEFDETLMHRCTVYGSRNGPNNSVKYAEKLCLIYISVNGAPGLDIGKHWVDLTRLLPLTFEELEGEKSFGKWSTSFNLSGKAKGGKLNVSLGFLVTQDKVANLSGNPNVPQVIDAVPKRSSSLDTGARRMLRRVGSVPSNVASRPAFSSQTLDLKVSQEVMLTGGLELSKSINFLCQRLDEGKLGRVIESDSEDVVPLKPQPDLDGLSAKGIEEYEDDNDVEFTIVEVGTEIPEKEKLNSDRVSGDANDVSAIENIYVDDVIEDYDIDLDEKTMIVSKDVCGNYVDDFMVNETKHEEDSICRSNMKEVESAELNHPFALEECLEERGHMELKSTYMASKTGKKSLSLDDVTESVSNEFLNMLGMDGCWSSNSDPESPRELLLREFEKEALTSGDLFFNVDWNEEQPEIGSSVSPVSYYEDYFENSDLSMIIQAAEEESKRESDLLKRRKATILEGLETEALMREWGLNETDFQNSPRILSGGFGSPIDLPLEEPPLPPLEVGFGPYVRMRGGGFLQSMNPSLFRNAKNSGTLVIQVSNPIVIPAKLGYDVVEILQQLALGGIGKLHMQVSKLMPLENITGKTIHQVAWEAVPTTVVSESCFRFEQILYGESKDEGFPSSWNFNDLRSELEGGEMGSDYVSLECLVPLAINKIEALSLEGLRIQSHMSDSEAPSSIYPQSGGRITCPHANCGEIFRSGVGGGLRMSDFRDSDDDIDELLDLSLSLEEWSRLDANIRGDEDQSREQFLKILAAHDAKCTDLVDEILTEDGSCSDLSGRNCGVLGNNLTIALMVQLRDPFRNYEPVGGPMLALIQVERGITHSIRKIPSTVLNDSNEKEHDVTILEDIDGKETERNEGDEEGNPQFKIIDVHLAGVDTESGNEQLWGTTTQLQSGSRWLLAAGLGKAISFPLSNSKAIVRSSPLASAKWQYRDSFWSISSTSHVQDTRAAWKDLIAPHIRNPNVIFLNETIKPH